MEARIADPYKAEIIAKFERVKKNVAGVISKLESDSNWQGVHNQIGIATQELKQASILLVRRHIEVCVVKHKKKRNLPIVRKDVEEIVRLYKYLD